MRSSYALTVAANGRDAQCQRTLLNLQIII